MTDEKINDAADRWVMDRARCSLDLVFDALIEIVERDVKDMNSLPATLRGSDKFWVEHNGDGLNKRLRVRRHPEQEPANYYVGAVTFVKSSTCIDVVIAPGDNFRVVPKWENSTSSCQLHVGEQQLKVWQISCKALSPLFFGAE